MSQSGKNISETVREFYMKSSESKFGGGKDKMKGWGAEVGSNKVLIIKSRHLGDAPGHLFQANEIRPLSKCMVREP